ncbi:CDP-diacylglycerol--glycerol-3-phosphate 3-phosphatidyltransferase [Saccharopolyspora rectivirgula]|uniref:CDP-diacylglycerol--glycerol-3-phosphate 3-phosphatidyltransferase n=1 Tax=Saccharopolyspora rectivirgula TaxID=28042 RepID=A0A073AY71_9PSEU|nr:CDP-diacylglycerol--glycerol-3-phosphate 3-phosphatidyltransferase [Saccharopolyspora rectivirgula]
MVQDSDSTTDGVTTGEHGAEPRKPSQNPQPHQPDPGIARLREAAAGVVAGPWLTVPNLLSVLRLAGVPLFLWLLLGPKAELLALLVLVVSGITDWLDGKLARWLNQYSRLGELLDPAADRLYIIATLIAFVLREVVPWWVAAALIVRDVVLALCLPVLRWHGYRPPEVHYLGKAATFCLMYAFPLLLLIQGDFPFSEVARPAAFALTCWGGALYLWAGVLYFGQVVAAVRRARTAPRG